MDIKNRIEIAKINLRKAENTKITKETQQKAAIEQKNEVIEKMAQEGVTPETIATEIAALESAVVDNLTKVESLIPRL